MAKLVALKRMVVDEAIPGEDGIVEAYAAEELAADPDIELHENTVIWSYADLTRIGEEASRAVRPRPGRRAVPDEEKVRALQLYESGMTVSELKSLLGREERTLRRWFAEARQSTRSEVSHERR